MDQEHEAYFDDPGAPVRLGLSDYLGLPEYVPALHVSLAECFVALLIGVLLLSVIGGATLVVIILAGLV